MPNIDLDHLEKRLAESGLKSSDLKGILEGIEPMKKFKPRKWFPKGIIRDDIVSLHFDLTPDQFVKAVGGLANYRGPFIRQWEVFPLGTINPDAFRVVIDVGRPLGR